MKVAMPIAAGMFVLALLHAPETSAASRRLASNAPVGEAAASQPMTFPAACMTGERVLIAGVGDLLFHESLQRQALAPASSYRRFFSGVESILKGADIAYGNLEGPAAGGVAAGGGAVRDPGRQLDGRVYGTVPGALIFNYHPSVAADLKAVGFSVVSTANNHGADRGALGIDRTIDALEAAGVTYAGTRRRTGLPGALAGSWTATTEAKGVRIAWIACSYGTNGMPDRHNQVLQCYRDRDVVMGEIGKAAADPSIDAVILTPHWGLEGSPTPLKSDRDYARAAIEAGTTAIIGAHPHVLQPWERIETSSGRDGLVVYSTGNFVSNQVSPAQRSGLIALLELVKPASGGKARVSAAGFVPTWLDKSNGHRVVEMGSQGGEIGAALKGTMKLLPAANRVSAKTMRNLPKPDCAPSPQPDIPQLALAMSAPLRWPLEPPTIEATPTDLRAATVVAIDTPVLSLPLPAPAIASASPTPAAQPAVAVIATTLPSLPPLDAPDGATHLKISSLPPRPSDQPSLPPRQSERVLRALAVAESRDRHGNGLTLEDVEKTRCPPPPRRQKIVSLAATSARRQPAAAKVAKAPGRRRKAAASASKARKTTAKSRKRSQKH